MTEPTRPTRPAQTTRTNLVHPGSLQERALHAYREQQRREEAQRVAALELEEAHLRRLIRTVLEMPDDSADIVWLPPVALSGPSSATVRVQIDGLQFGAELEDKTRGYFLVLYMHCESCNKARSAYVYSLGQLIPRTKDMRFCIACRRAARKVAQSEAEAEAEAEGR